MNEAESTRMDRLNQYLDNVANGTVSTPDSVDPDFVPTMLQLKRLDSVPGPDPTFVERLRRDMFDGIPVTEPPAIRRIPRHWIRRVDVASAAALIVAVLAITIVQLLNDPDESQDDRVAIAGETPTTSVQTEVESTIPPTDEPVALASPTAAPQTATPEATVPAGITPPVGAADIPIYTSLQQLVNAADVVVTGQATGNITTRESGQRLSEFRVDRTLRGPATDATIVLNEMTDLEIGATYLLFLSYPQWDDEPIYTVVMTSPVIRVQDGLIVRWEPSGPDSPLSGAYSGQPLEALAEDMAAIPEIEPVIEELVAGYGWEPIDKGLLRIVELPDRAGYATEKPLRFSDVTWGMALAASQPIGLDFSRMGGRPLQLLPYYLERPQTDGQRSIQAMLLIDEDQRIVGAWITVSLEDEAFRLDERDRVVNIPAAVPTPEPTPTFPIPAGETVNPAQLYNLADAHTMIFCWPYCIETPPPEALRAEIVAALDRELPIEDVNAYPSPTPDRSLGQASGDHIAILFWPNEPFQGPSTAFTYDRVAGKILLPFDGGWIDAPPELAVALEDVEVPPPPTKEKP